MSNMIKLNLSRLFFCLFFLIVSFCKSTSQNLDQIQELVKQQNWEKALSEITSVCINFPSSLTCGEALLLKSNIHFNKGEMDAGLKQYDEVIEIGISLNSNSLLERAYGGKGEVLYIRGEYESSLPVMRKFLTVLKPEDQISYSNGLMQIGNCFRFLGRLDSADYFLNLALQKKITIEHREGLPITYLSLGAVAVRKGYVEEAIALNLKSIEILEELKDSIQLSHMYFATANLLNTQEDYNQALEYAERALNIVNKKDLKTTKANVLLSRARPLAKLGRPSQALLDLKKALTIYNQSKIGFYIGDCYHEIGWIFLNQRNLDSAKYYFEKLLTVAKKRSDQDDFFNAYSDLGHLSLAENKSSNAIHYFKMAKSYVQKENYKKRSQIENGLYKANKIVNNQNLAMAHLENYATLKDSAYSLEKTKLFYDLEAKYNRSFQEKEIEVLETENQISTLRLANSRKWLITLIFGLLGIGILLARIFASRKKIKEQNKIISKALSEKDTLIKEIHHRVKNNLQFISSLLSLQSEHLESSPAISALKEGQGRVQSMALIHQNLYQEDNLTGIQMKDYLENLTNNLFDSYNISPDRISLELEIEDINLDVDTMIPLGLVINELISNSLKYAFQEGKQGIISVSIKELNNQLILNVKDNGIGIQEKEIMSGSFGYRLLNAFKKQLNAELEVDGRNGTNVKMLINDYMKSA